MDKFNIFNRIWGWKILEYESVLYIKNSISIFVWIHNNFLLVYIRSYTVINLLKKINIQKFIYISYS